MTDSFTPQRPKDALRQSGLRPKKSWGQNFLRDQEVLADIVAAVGYPDGGVVLELGAGTGVLTQALGAFGLRVVAVERDRDLVPLLRALPSRDPGAVAALGGPFSAAPHHWLAVLEADAARLDYAGLAASLAHPLSVVGNLPYQLSGRILVSLAEGHNSVSQATLMIQKEVAQRLVAEPNTKAYGLLTVLVRRKFEVIWVRDVAPEAFYPPPKVTSAVVTLVAKDMARQPDAAIDDALIKVAKAAFSVRRKTLRNALQSGLGWPRVNVEALLSHAGIDPAARAETLALQHYIRLAEASFLPDVMHKEAP